MFHHSSERMEMVVDIYESVDAIRGHNPYLHSTDTKKDPDTAPHTGGDTAWSRCCRVTAVCAVLLCVLLMAAFTLLWFIYNTMNTECIQLQTSYNNLTIERDQLETSYNNLTKERDQLETSYNNLTKERDQLETSYNNLTIERDQLETSYNNLTKERDQLETSYNNLTIERDQLETSYNNLTIERDQLETSYNSLTKERDQLQTSYNNLTIERDQLQTSNNNLVKGKNQLQTSYNTLTIERDQLQRERDRCLRTLCDLYKEHKMCFISNSSLYIMSKEYKNWTESRQDCRDKGADLVIINSREEQDFIINQVKDRIQVWIGLSDRDTEGEWKWGDNTTLTTAFWDKNEPNDGGGDEDCAEFYSNSNRNFWNDKKCSENLQWICEKHLLQ